MPLRTVERCRSRLGRYESPRQSALEWGPHRVHSIAERAGTTLLPVLTPAEHLSEA